MPGGLQLRVERGMLPPRLVPHPCELGSAIPQIGVNTLSMRQIEGDSPKHLFQTESGEGIRDAFGRFAPQEGIHYGIQRNPAPEYVIPSFALFHVFLRHE
jgi:hypothetical protein